MSTLPPLVTVADLEKRLGLVPGSLAGEDLTRAEADIDDVSVLIRDATQMAFIDDIDGTVAAPDAVLVIAVRAAKRSFLNPDEYSGETAGDYSWQARLTGVYLTDDERETVIHASWGYGSDSAGAWNGTGSIRTPSPYCDVPPQPPNWWELP